MSQEPAPSTGVRPEIQALRAVAVVAVVVYHLWPTALPGGFVGVDVFFAISGFLITAHLLRETVATGGVSVIAFWTRRLRRLLPASLLVLAITAVAIVVWVPPYTWAEFLREIAASALYVENWSLAANAVDYLASDNVATPVQHFWSLSVEEQFYVVWPLLILAAIAVARRTDVRRPTAAIAVVLGVVVAASLVHSVVLTATDTSLAYFATSTRAWEFGAGGLLAIAAAGVRSDLVRVRTAVSLLGWAAIAVAVFAYSDATPFPGAAALLPVLGALAVIWAGSAGIRLSPTFVARARPVRALGDISYSLYLWHWPLIVLLPYALGSGLEPWSRLAIAAASVALAWATKRWVEDPVRRGTLSRRRPRATLVATAAAMAIVVAGVGIGSYAIEQQVAADDARVRALLADGTPCFGAAAFDPLDQPCDNPDLDGTVVPAIATSKQDIPPTWGDCAATTAEPVDCRFGVDGGTRVALIGDSHAHQFVSAFRQIADAKGWELHVYVKGGCYFSHVSKPRNTVEAQENCDNWNRNLDAELAAGEPYEYVFTALRAETNVSYIVDEGSTPEETALEGFRASWQPLIDRGTLVVGVHDVRDTLPGVKECLVDNPDDFAACDGDATELLRHTDQLAVAASTIEGAAEIDLTDYFCRDGVCPAVVGGVLVFSDGDHITDTFARTLSPYILTAFETVLRDSRNR